MGSLTSAVERILESNDEICRRIAALETSSLVGTSRSATSTVRNLVDIDDQASTITPEAQAIPESAHSTSMTEAPAQLGPSIESELYRSRVYSRTTHRHSLSSLPSGDQSAPGWSFFSNISLAQVSNISVISLPISCLDIWNSHHYKPLPGSETNIEDNMSRMREESSRRKSEPKSRYRGGRWRFFEHVDLLGRTFEEPGGGLEHWSPSPLSSEISDNTVDQDAAITVRKEFSVERSDNGEHHTNNKERAPKTRTTVNDVDVGSGSNRLVSTSKSTAWEKKTTL